jgi:hypothetical protein
MEWRNAGISSENNNNCEIKKEKTNEDIGNDVNDNKSSDLSSSNNNFSLHNISLPYW